MARRGENIYKRKDGRWEGRYIKGKDSAGKATYGYVYSKTYNEVKEKQQKQKMIVKFTFYQKTLKVLCPSLLCSGWIVLEITVNPPLMLNIETPL